MDRFASEGTGKEIPEKTRSPRARSLPNARAFRVATCISLLFLLSLVGAATSLTLLLIRQDSLAKNLLIGSLACSGVTWLAALLKRRAVLCPLCKGTPLLNSGARVHSRARCFPPFNHAFSAIASIVASQKFRCMYCGTDYDLLKPRTRPHHRRTPGENP